MKIITHICRLIVGVLFILSGFVKLVDPMGFSFKLEEYFSEPVLNIPFFEPYSLPIAIVVVIFEFLVGVMLLVGFKRKFTLWSLLVMIVFFTGLTLYSAVTGKVTDCGCFGDAVKLTPWETFWKDVTLLVLILVLFAGAKYIKPLWSKKFAFRFSVVTLICCVVLCNYVLSHLPIIDFRPYKVGTVIREGMEMPESITEFLWKFNVNGEEKVIKTMGQYPDVDGEYISVETNILVDGGIPPIHDFTMEDENGEDHVEEMLDEPKLIVMVSYNLYSASDEGLKAIKEATDKAIKAGYKVIAMTSALPETANEYKENYGFNFEFYISDPTMLKTMIRSNPGLIKIESGVIKQKLHYNDASDLEL
ncbi:hypothetical protein NBRC110019_30690 [Neptunitalea chrysea]|uniref:Methylamine utilisation protein MauE domain-containing protein n=1 Tax=Neptunitalea chrysea TaxID=1647581 RepID=A0A9W6B9L4_9FLAO|nr:BT_3928 family protein [Neptunitalea chrysea]GLB54028.1 hypothetical protein NBRC110019_30690 [Neptunitalea chrysea]